MTIRAVAPEAQFLQGDAGPLFALYHPPAKPGPSLVTALHVPAFAEEMNKARRMTSLQARGLASLGVGSLLLDLYGTGDSHGDFGDARWEIWKRDLRAGVEWLRKTGSEVVHLWCLRVGCLLALDFLRDHRDLGGRVVLWKPVIDGKTAMTQFLRLKTAAAMMHGEKQTVGALRERLVNGEPVEVAGYRLSPHLVSAIDGVGCAPLLPPRSTQVDWFEISNQPDGPVAPAVEKVLAGWREQGAHVVLHRARGEPFWSTQEITTAEELLDQTSALFRGAGEGAPARPSDPVHDGGPAENRR